MFFKQPEKLILASGSPRRQQILQEAGISFSINTKDTPEDYPQHLPVEEIPSYLAWKKAKPFLTELSDETILTADTIVILAGEVIGKPENEKDACQMLKKLSGNCHTVITGVCIVNQNKKVIFSEKSKVYFRELSNEEIAHYVNTYKPLDKAGAYGVQDWIGMVAITRIEGSFYNIMGLPIHKVLKELEAFMSGE